MGRIISFSSGKGGSGKTFSSVNFSAELASRGNRVLIFDLDINCSNVFILLHVKPETKLQDYFEGNIPLRDCILKSEHGIDVISAGINVQRFVQFENDYNLSNLATDLKELKDDYDYIIIDYAAGINQMVMRFYAMSDDIVLVANPEITALADLYRLMKMLYVNNKTNKMYLLVNKVKNIDWAINLHKEVKKVSEKFSLKIDLKLLAPILFDDEKVMRSVQKRTPLIKLFPKTPIKGGFALAVTRYLNEIGESLDDKDIKSKTFSNFF